MLDYLGLHLDYLLKQFYFLEKYHSETAIKKSVSISERSTNLLARRGKILDRNGSVLAEDIPSYEIGLDLNNFSFNPKEIKKISYLLDIDRKTFTKRLSDKKKKYLKLIPYAWKLIDNRMKNNSNFNDLINFLKENPKIKKNEN